MALPQVLLVDDSQAVLEFGKAVLGSHYLCSTASDGAQALDMARLIKPEAIVLDLSMPRMDGDECLARLKADPELSEIPVLILSSEAGRAEACLKLGAEDWLGKPASASELGRRVGRMVEAAALRRSRQAFGYLPFLIGGSAMAFPLADVVSVHSLPAVKPLPAGPGFFRSFVQWHGEAVGLLDFAEFLGLSHSVAPLERRLMVVSHGAEKIALAADEVSDPSEAPRELVQASDGLGGSRIQGYGLVLAAIISTHAGLIPVIRPLALLEDALLAQLKRALEQARREGGGD